METKEMVRSTNSSILRCGDIMEILGVSDGMAYRIIRQLNEELEAKGFHTSSRTCEQTVF